MMKLRKRARVVVLAVACVSAALVGAGCGSEPFDAAGADAQTGTLSAALSTTGSDGATYRLVTGSFIHLIGTSFGAGYPIDGTETVFTKKLGVGNYSLDLSFGAYSTPTLVREENGVTTIVNAEWKDTRPLPFAITAGAVTNVVLHFSVPGLANVTFATGDVSVSLDVTKDERSQPTYATENGAVTVGNVTFADPTAPYATALADAVGNVRHQAIGVHATGPWTLDGDTACLPVSAASVGGDLTTEPTFYPRLTQMLSGAGTVCIRDGGTTDSVSIRLAASGAVPADQLFFLPDPAGYERFVYFSGSIPDVFDGTTLVQSALAGNVAVTDASFTHQLFDSTGSLQLSLLVAFAPSGSTFTLVP